MRIVAFALVAVLAVACGGGPGAAPVPPALQAAPLLLAVVTTMFSMIGTFIILKLVDSMTGLRVSSEEEATGLDLSQHNERAYS